MSSIPVPRDHAADAAKLLRRLAIFILAVAAPAVALFSRNTAAVSLPIAMAVLGFGNVVDPERGALAPRIRAGFRSPLVLIALYLALWLILSLAWTPFPGPATSRLAAAIAIALAAGMAMLGLPERMRASTLNLVPIGAFLGALAAAGVAAASAFDVLPRWLSVDRSITERGVAFVCLSAFAGAGWLFSRGRWLDGVALMVVAVAAVAAQRSLLSATAISASLVAFGLARFSQRAAAITIASYAVATLLIAPLAPVLARLIDPAWFGIGGRDINPVEALGLAFWSEPLRMITGHGFDSLRHAVRAGLVPLEATRLPHVELWFEAGLPGILAIGFGAIAAARWASRASAGLSAAALAVLGAIVTYSAGGYGLSQNWWLATIAVVAVILASIMRGQFRTERPALKPGRPLVR